MRSLLTRCLGLGVASVVVVACSPAPNPQNDGGTDSGADVGPSKPLPFTPSNIDLGGLDLSNVGDQDIASSCEIRTAEGDSQDCFSGNGFVDTTVLQSDGSKLHIVVVKSLRVEPAAHMLIHGDLPYAIVSLGDFQLMGVIDAHATSETPGPGGFRALGNQKGAGPCGGAGATGVTLTPGAGAGGGSNCGVGGQGTLELGAAGQPGAKTPACGTPQLIPLAGGSSGGGGDIGGGGGGGALQLVSGGAFTMAASASINVGGGGGDAGGTTGQDSGGGGAGGALLIEAVSAKIAGVVAANGGGGGGGGIGSNAGGDGAASSTPAAGGPGSVVGGDGSAGATIDGMSAPAETIASSASGGGGGAGRVRINSVSGQADLGGATLSPPATTSCATQGVVAP